MSELATLSCDLPKPLVVKLTRIPFGSFVTLTLDDGATEDLEPDEAREWFKIRGANMEGVEKALDYVWNFYTAGITVHNPKKPILKTSRVTPRI
jgi:hypothetical protein